MVPSEARAVIDIGSHSVLLLVAGGPGRSPKVLLEDCRITALGSGMDRNRRIQTGAASRTRRVIEDYLHRCRALGIENIRLVGTAALREAKNRDEVAEYLSGQGAPPVEVLSPDREADLTRAGALSGLTIARADRTVVADLGGRSTEVTWPGYALSLPTGCQRASDSFLTSDPPGREEIAALDRHLQEQLAALPRPPEGGRLIVSGGTSTTLASMDLALFRYRSEAVHGHTLPCSRLDRQARELLAMPLSERKKLTGLEPERAPVIPAGARILEALCRWHTSGEVQVSARGLTWGVWLER